MKQEILEALKALTEATRAVERLLDEQLQEKRPWIPVKEAASRLGVSHHWILERIRKRYYKYGVHFVNTSDGSRPKYLVSVAAIRRELMKPPEKRNTVKSRF
jgi:hypothetical protein